MTPDRSGCTAPRHGSVNDYRRGCRCDYAREARRLYVKRWREGRLPPGMVPSLGTARRLQALAAVGWPVREVGHRLGRDRRKVALWRATPNKMVLSTTAAAVAVLYEQLQGTQGPSVRARRGAVRAGWAAPLAWDDAAIDDPHARPVTVLGTRRDVQGEARFLASFGESFEQIAKQLGVQATSIERAVYRARRVAS